MTRDRAQPVGVTVDGVCAVALTQDRVHEAVVHGRIELHVGRIVFVAFDRDEELMGFAFPREEREALVTADPATFLPPRASEVRSRWVLAAQLASTGLSDAPR